ncbi:hypothetical protein MNV49_002986 [Pseudohyphozyma bogoriensis]|nr:hypothetical protein MNV49_002986 [Pseudohyphozyma bogoriensis]
MPSTSASWRRLTAISWCLLAFTTTLARGSISVSFGSSTSVEQCSTVTATYDASTDEIGLKAAALYDASSATSLIDLQTIGVPTANYEILSGSIEFTVQVAQGQQFFLMVFGEDGSEGKSTVQTVTGGSSSCMVASAGSSATSYGLFLLIRFGINVLLSLLDDCILTRFQHHRRPEWCRKLLCFRLRNI